MSGKQLACLALVAAFATVASTPAEAGPTKVERYTPFQRSGELKNSLYASYRRGGDCWTSSLVVTGRGVFRCIIGRYIHDPCYYDYEAAYERVVCVGAPWRREVMILRAHVSESDPARGLMPWALRLANGRRCQFVTGASGMARGHRANYMCTGRRVGYGRVLKRRRVWKIRVARNFRGDGMRWRAISKAWY